MKLNGNINLILLLINTKVTPGVNRNGIIVCLPYTRHHNFCTIYLKDSEFLDPSYILCVTMFFSPNV